MIANAGAALLLRKQKGLRRDLQNRPNLLPIRIAFLCGSTVNEVAALLELLLLDQGIQPVFYFSDYNKYFEEAVLDAARLAEFKPDIIFVYTSSANIQGWPPLDTSEADLNAHVVAESIRFAAIWNGLQSLGAVVVQNNFELPIQRLLGNYDAVSPVGRVRFINLLNTEFAREAAARTNLLIHDLNVVAASATRCSPRLKEALRSLNLPPPWCWRFMAARGSA
jgi:predicted enzyme involved in methoxymalonyl-ACP biosynthesis